MKNLLKQRLFDHFHACSLRHLFSLLVLQLLGQDRQEGQQRVQHVGRQAALHVRVRVAALDGRVEARLQADELVAHEAVDHHEG